jgi:hypothetical protein
MLDRRDSVGVMPTPRNSEQDRLTFHVPRELRLEAERAADEQDLTLAQLCRRGLRLALQAESVVLTTATRDSESEGKTT